MKDCIILCLRKIENIQSDWEYIFTLHDLEFKWALDTWFEYNFGNISLYVISNNEIVDTFSFKNKKKFDMWKSKGFLIVDEYSKGLKISSYEDLISYINDMTGVSFLRTIKGLELAFGDKKILETQFTDKICFSYLGRVRWFWEVPYLVYPYIFYDVKEFCAPEDLGKYYCSRAENASLYNEQSFSRLGFYVVYSKLWFEDLYKIFSKGREFEFLIRSNNKRADLIKRMLTMPAKLPKTYNIEIALKREVIHDFLIGEEKSPLFDVEDINSLKEEIKKPKLILVEGGKLKESDNGSSVYIPPPLTVIKGGKYRKKDEIK